MCESMLQGFLRTIRKRGNMKKQYYCNPLNMDYRYQFIEDMRSGEDKIPARPPIRR